MPGDATVRILLLRGVNVGGKSVLPMAGLREVLAGQGLIGVKTHIQSGNAVFRDPIGAVDLAERITVAIESGYGFRPKAMMLEVAVLLDVLAANPFALAGAENGAAVHIGFLAAPALHADLDRLRALAAKDEAFHLTEAAFYLHAPSGIGRSKLAAAAEKTLGVAMTLRNQRVAEAVSVLAQDLE